jgi:hypothetical protein
MNSPSLRKFNLKISESTVLLCPLYFRLAVVEIFAVARGHTQTSNYSRIVTPFPRSVVDQTLQTTDV